MTEGYFCVICYKGHDGMGCRQIAELTLERTQHAVRHFREQLNHDRMRVSYQSGIHEITPDNVSHSQKIADTFCKCNRGAL
jgi:hypothetical protein